MQELGITQLRLDFDWSVIEPVEGTFDWIATDRIVNAARSRGIVVHGLITYTPAWARPAATDGKHPPTEPADMAAFSRSVVRRYRPSGIRSWEIWNEPNIPNFWSAEGGPDADRYAELLAVTAQAIRAEDPGAVVISGGLSPAGDEPGVSIAPGTFLQQMFVTLPAGRIDGVGIHPYSFPAMPTGGQSWNTFSGLADLRRIAAAGEGRTLPLWITEFGAPTGSSNRAVTPAQQAEMMDDALACLTGLDWVGPVFLYNLRDRSGGDPADVEDNFGLFSANRSPKPVVGSLRRYLAAPAPFAAASNCPDW